MYLIYRLFLAFNSTYLLVVVFLIKEKYNLWSCYANFIYVSWFIFIFIAVIFTYISFCIAKKLPKDNLSSSSITDVELADNNFLPTYLGYFFVSLGINDIPTLIVIFLIIYVFTFLSQALYFNPIFLLFGYHFYFIKTKKNIRIFLITKKQLKNPSDNAFANLRRINDFTFIDI